MFYTPFLDKQGNPKKLTDIEYSDLDILTNIEEGYKVEYKSLWDDKFKKKALPKSISSFANTDGGWLFVGVNNDGTLQPISKDRTDFAQQIGEIIRTHISPCPKFETKFITLPNDDEHGILIIVIYEGVNPPYICDGTVYTRIGSSSEPIKIQHRADIDKLYAKKKDYIDEWKNFCTNKIFDQLNIPYCSIYLYYEGGNTTYTEDIKGNEEFLNTCCKKCGFEVYMPSTYNSYIFYNSKNVGFNCCTSCMELFRNWSVRFHTPFCTLPQNIHDLIAEKINSYEHKIDIQYFTGIDGYLTCELISNTISKILEQLALQGCNINDYKIKIDVFNAKNTYLFFPTKDKQWRNLAISNFRHALMNTISTDIPYRLENEGVLLNAFLILAFGISYPFGYSYNEFSVLYAKGLEVRKELLDDIRFTSEEYFKRLELFINNYL